MSLKMFINPNTDSGELKIKIERKIELDNCICRDVLFEYHRAVVPFC